MSQSPWGALRIAGWLLLTLVVLLLFVLPLMTSLMVQVMDETPPVLSKYLDGIVIAQRWLMRITACFFFFAFGSCFASFLNVVAWRVPRGRSILGPSRCPYCHQQLSFRDNFPVVGWIRNGGRCRTCRLPINVRYLVVEVILGSVFLGIGLMTLASGGASLPVRPPNNLAGFERVLFDPQWDLLQIVGAQLVLILFLFTFALIEADDDDLEIPVSLLFSGLICGIGMAFAFPAILLLVYDWPTRQIWPIPLWSPEQVITLVVGFVLGSGLGWLFQFRFGKSQPKSMPEEHADPDSTGLSTESNDDDNAITFCNAWYGMGLIGLFLGWQSALVVAIWYAIFWLAWMGTGPKTQMRSLTNRIVFCCCG